MTKSKTKSVYDILNKNNIFFYLSVIFCDKFIINFFFLIIIF